MKQRIPDEVERAHYYSLPGEGETFQHVQLILEDPHPECEFGYTEPGYYFWDETQAFIYGPYDCQEDAQEALAKYAAYLQWSD